MTPPPVNLELADIQGGILTAYGRIGFPKARYLLLHVADAAAGRGAIEFIRRRVTTALRWTSERSGIPTGRVPPVPRPPVTINLAFTFYGLRALGVPTRTLRGCPDAFIDGMAARAAILGDDVPGNDLRGWDPVWRLDGERRPHVLVMLNAQMLDDGTAHPALDRATREIADYLARTNGGITLLSGHAGASPDWQELSALLAPKDGGGVEAIPREHFGFVDAISDPVFEGQFPDRAAEGRAVGNGKVDGRGGWSPLATGEFLLGWPDEAQEIPGAAMPLDFSRNGTFIAYRKLHQDAPAFEGWIATTARRFGALWGIGDPVAARETLMAKLAGRWSDGVPLIAARDHDEWTRFNRDHPALGTPDQRRERARRLVEFSFGDDRAGARCPVAAHTRRMNTRDMLDPVGGSSDRKARMGSALNNRRRILRRGLPYGGRGDPHGEHGIVMLAVCASLSRQFEFVQQQWINYGLDFGAGNDTCPLVGNHGPNARFVIPADPGDGHPPFIADQLPRFVSTRGGEYFFVPSMTALRMIGMGVVDPT